jgi:hypothetical protein
LFSLTKREKKAIKKRNKANMKSVSFGAPQRALDATGFPQRMKTTHRYVEAIFATASAGAIKLFVLSANGMFDPNITGSGHQPTYFDVMSSMYDHYTVLSSRIRVQALIHTATNTSDNVVWGIVQHDSASPAFTTAANACEQPKSSYMLIDGDAGAGGVDSNSLTLSFNALTTFGSRALSDPELRGTPAANPTEQNYFVLFAQDSNLSNTVAMDYLVTLDFVAEWTELKANLTN